MESVQDEKIGYKTIMRQKEYCKLIIANLINRFGDSIDAIAFTWLVYAITGKASWSAIIFAVNNLPTIFLQPFAGAIIENKNKKNVMVVTDIVRGLCVGFIAFAFAFGILKPWMILITTIIISSVEAFRLPASSAIIPKILEKRYYEFGMSMNSSVSKIVELIGLGIAGFVIASFGITTAIVIDVVTFFGSAIVISMINSNENNLGKSSIDIRGYMGLLKEGINYVKGKKVVWNLTMLAVLVNAIFVPFNSLQAPLVKEILHSGEQMLSVLGLSLTIGMLLATVFYPYVSKILNGNNIVGAGGIVAGLYYIILVGIGKYITNMYAVYLLVIIGTFITGIGISLLATYVNVEFMKNVEQEYLARSAALLNALATSATPIVSLIVSALVGIMSVKYVFVGSGVVQLFIILMIFASKMQFTEKSKEELKPRNIDNKIEEVA